MKLHTPIVIGLLALFSVPVAAHDTGEIVAVIEKLTAGVDAQDAALLQEAFSEDAALFATRPDGDGMITLSASAFAAAHGNKQFGGQQRNVTIEYVDIADDLVAVAKVLAANEQLHYTYYLGFSKIDGAWRIQTFLQRSRMAEAKG